MNSKATRINFTSLEALNCFDYIGIPVIKAPVKDELRCLLGYPIGSIGDVVGQKLPSFLMRISDHFPLCIVRNRTNQPLFPITFEAWTWVSQTVPSHSWAARQLDRGTH